MRPRIQGRILGIDPSSQGFGFAVLEGENLIDWGTKSARRDKDRESLSKIRDLFVRYRPKVVVLENCSGSRSRRCARVQHLIEAIKQMALAHKIKVRSISPAELSEAQGGFEKATKHEVAVTIAHRFPELKRHLPPHRRPWMSQDERMRLFVAAAMVATTNRSRWRQP